jgi:hypothetical protein
MKMSLEELKEARKENWFEYLKGRQNIGDPERPNLEKLALNWASALGWSFNKPITQRESSVEELPLFTPGQAMLYAGSDSDIPDEKLVKLVDSAHIEIRIGARGRYRLKAVVSTGQLRAFKKYWLYLKEHGLLTDEWLEPRWHMCQCKYPVHEEARHCPHCGAVNVHHVEYVLYGSVDEDPYRDPAPVYHHQLLYAEGEYK